MATYKYLDYEGLKTLAKNVNDKISSITTSSIDLDDIEWGVLTRPALGAFYIEGASTPYSFEIGMTWEDWCSSEYSEECGWRLYCSASGEIRTAGGRRICYEDYTVAHSSDIIIDNYDYNLPDYGGGGSDD